jgi:phage terminase small subunit
MKDKLTPKQQRFVEEYLIDLNGKQAAIRAKYSEATAEQQASRLLTNVKVSRAIEAAIKARSERRKVDADYVVTGLMEVAERCLQRKPVMVWDRSKREMVQATTDEGEGIWQFDSTGANRAFELLGKHVNIFEKKEDVKAPSVRQFSEALDAKVEEVWGDE